jgi:hypothetical protein
MQLVKLSTNDAGSASCGTTSSFPPQRLSREQQSETNTILATALAAVVIVDGNRENKEEVDEMKEVPIKPGHIDDDLWAKLNDPAWRAAQEAECAAREAAIEAATARLAEWVATNDADDPGLLEDPGLCSDIDFLIDVEGRTGKAIDILGRAKRLKAGSR